jgi:GntR family transcriptional regulator, transcriptional repressor for pyruvate dehydrogenase complex
MPDHSESLSLYQPVSRRDGLATVVKTQLLDMISHQQLRAGDQLPPERELANQFGVSRNVVREALRSLVEMNVLDSKQGAGVFVTALDIESLVAPLEFVVSLEPATLRSLIDARLLIEPGIAKLAAERGSAQQREALAALIGKDQDQIVADPTRFMELDVQLHSLIIRMAGNPFLARIMDGLGHLARRSRGLTNTVPEMRATAHADHERIVAAVVAQDGEAAFTAMQDHLAHVARTLDAGEPDEG